MQHKIYQPSSNCVKEVRYLTRFNVSKHYRHQLLGADNDFEIVNGWSTDKNGSSILSKTSRLTDTNLSSDVHVSNNCGTNMGFLLLKEERWTSNICFAFGDALVCQSIALQAEPFSFRLRWQDDIQSNTKRACAYRRKSKQNLNYFHDMFSLC